MKRRDFLQGTLSAALAPFLAKAVFGASGGKRGGDRPNILFIMSDDHAANAIGCYNSWLAGYTPTKHIDRIAREGMRFDNCFVTNSICTPSRAAILTGQYSHKNGVYTLSDRLDPKRQHVAKLLQKAGYRTAIVGKWHLHCDPSGFDYWNILPGQGRYYDPVLIEMGKKKTHKGYSSDVIGGLMLDWLKKQRGGDKPFFAMCHFKASHRPWSPPKKFAHLFEGVKMPEPPNFLDDYKHRSRAAANARLKIGENMIPKYDLKRPKPPGLKGMELRRWAYQIFIKDYLRCIAAMDENIGRLLDFLDESGLRDNTVVFYTSDQGVFIGEHGYFDKRFMYEESLRMPLLVRYPREIRPGSVNKDIVLNIDFAPTFLDSAGVPIPSEMQGRSIRPLLDGKTPADWRTEMYYRYWMHLAHHGVPAHYGIRTKRYKLIYYYGKPLGMKGAIKKPTEPEWELFDLEKDPHEMNNVYDDPAYADVVKRLKAELEKLRRELGDTG